MPWTTCGACGEAAFISDRDQEAGAEVYCSPECADTRREGVTTNFNPITETRTCCVHVAGLPFTEYRRGREASSDGMIQLEYRLLRVDGTPVGDRWFPVCPERLAWLKERFPRTLRFLVPEADKELGEPS